MTIKAETVDEIVRLARQGMSTGKIAKALGMSKSTVASIVKREKDKIEASAEMDGASVPVRAHASKEGAEPRPNLDGEMDGPYISRFTPKVAEDEVDTLLKITKKGYLEAHKKTDIPYDKRIWCEVQYVKMLRDAVKLVVAISGAADGTHSSATVSPLDEFAKMVEAFAEDE